jgi:flagellar hook-basal body complex protein FliE
MTAIPPIAPLSELQPVQGLSLPMPAAMPSTGGVSFSKLLSDGVESVNSNLLQADKMVHAFALDDSIPVHQVTFALEQARQSLDLMVQVRNRLIEGYQQLMNMQL